MQSIYTDTYRYGFNNNNNIMLIFVDGLLVRTIDLYGNATDSTCLSCFMVVKYHIGMIVIL